jgi:hypothetical protein
MSLAKAATSAGGVEASASPTTQMVGHAGADIAGHRLADQHVTIALVFEIAAPPKCRCEPALEQGIGNAGDAVLLDGGDTSVPGVGIADLCGGVAKD